MTGNDVGITIFLILVGVLFLFMSFKYIKEFHEDYIDTRLESGEAGGGMLFVNIMKLLPYWVYKSILFIFGSSILVGICVLLFNYLK